MHDELRRFGLRRTLVFTVALLVVGAVAGATLFAVAMFQPEWPAFVAEGWLTIALGASLGIVATVVLLVAGPSRAARRAWPTVPVVPAPQLRALAEGLALARGAQVPRVWWLESAAPNVACLPANGECHIIVSSATAHGLSRDELEAVMSLQFSLLVDDAAARVRRALVAASLMISWVIRLSLAALLVVLVRQITWAGLTINGALWCAIGLIVLIAFIQRRLRWSWGLVGDAVAIATTRHPDPLVTALRRLAGHNEGRVPVRSGFGAADPFWAVTVRSNVKIELMVVNGRAGRRSSTALVSDAALLLRARIVELSSLGGPPATLASWRETEATFRRLSIAAGDRAPEGVGDASVHGVTVTTEGATVGALAPRNGTWGATPPRPFLLRLKRPRPQLPTSAAMAHYDASMAVARRV